MLLTAVTEVAITSGAIEAGFTETITDFFANLGVLSGISLTTAGGFAVVLIYKLLKLLKFAKSNEFDEWLFVRIMNFIKNMDDEKHAKRVERIVAIAKTMPFVQTFIGEARDTKKKFILELEGRLYDIEAKIKSGLFEGDELVRLIEYKAKLLDELNG